MSGRAEERLRDLFETVDRQIDVGRLRPLRPAPRRWPPLAVAASILAILVGGLLVVANRQEDRLNPVTDRPAAALDPEEFDGVADDICLELERARNGIAPRFSTAEAYAVAIDNRRTAIDDAVAGLLTVPPPADDLALVFTVADELGAVRDRLDEVERAAIGGRLDDAAAQWAQVDGSIDRAVAALATHGASSCGRSVP